MDTIAQMVGEIMSGGASTKARLVGRRILVVEDEYMIADELAQFLQNEGAAVIGPAPSVMEALRLIYSTATIDCALLDINLRGEINFSVADALVQHGVPFAFTTGYDQKMIPARFSGVSRHEKPINLTGIANMVSCWPLPR